MACLLQGNKLLAENAPGGFKLPCREWARSAGLYLGRWQGKPCRLIDLGDAAISRKILSLWGLLDENPRLPIELLSLGGLGRMILHWQERSSVLWLLRTTDNLDVR